MIRFGILINHMVQLNIIAEVVAVLAGDGTHCNSSLKVKVFDKSKEGERYQT